MKLTLFLREHKLRLDLRPGRYCGNDVVVANIVSEGESDYIMICDGEPYRNTDGLVSSSGHSIDGRAYGEIEAIRSLVEQIKGRTIYYDPAGWADRVFIKVPDDLALE